MPDHATRRNRSLLRELSASDAQLTERALEQREKQQRKVLDAHARAIEDAYDDAERQLSTLVGKKELPALRSALRDQNLAMRNLLQPPKGLGRDLSALTAARKRKGDALLKEFGISRDKLKKISAGLQKRAPKIALPTGTVAPGFHTQSNLAQWTKLSPLHVVPIPWGVVPADLGPFSLFRPPFIDWPDHFDSSVFGGSVSRTHYSHAFAGYVGQDARMTVDGDPYASAGMIVETRMAFIYEVPEDGPLEIIVDATNATGTHDIRTENQWGWSDTNAEQINYLSIEVLHRDVTPFYAEMSRFTNTDEETTAHYESLIPGHHYFAHSLTNGALTGGRSVVILVGTSNLENCKCDDVRFNGETYFHWLIKSVEVRVRP